MAGDDKKAAGDEPETKGAEETSVAAAKEAEPKAKPKTKPKAKAEVKPAAKKLVKKPAAKKPAPEEKPAPTERMEVRRKISDLKDLGGAVESATAAAESAPAADTAPGNAEPGEAVLRQPQRDAQGRAYATGRRKDAVARVWIKPGQGLITVNGKKSDEYFARPVLRMLIAQPMVASRRETEYDIWCTVKGGGLSGQAGAVRHGISRALVNYDPELRGVLKAGGFMTRDSRVVERKKYGRAKARRSFQFSKR